jgi:putative acetyltransferase
MSPPPDVVVRTERPSDVARVQEILLAAFDGRSNEADLVDRLRANGHAPIALVAEEHGMVVGHIMFSVATLGTEGTAVLALAPLAVDPRSHRRGIGSRLVRQGLELARDRAEPVVAVLGSPAFYGRFGFRPARELGITGPDPSWGDALQALELPAYRPVAGQIVYPREFEESGTL